MSFKEINIRDLKESPVKMISEDWTLISAGNADGWNTMTASWGGVGELWNKDVAFIFIRPQRYTYEFIEKSEYFTLSFFGGEKRDELALCGSVSGRDVNKAEKTGFTPVFDGDSVYIQQAKTVIVCRKLAFLDIDPKGFLNDKIMACYTNGDYHRMYVGQIVKVLTK
ncbi:MAG: flavin reductase family protein [Clostridiales bacterium]|nr:flavin reductase family protein [Clostridiales bacterium]